MQKKQEFICKNLDEGLELAVKYFHLSEEKIFLNILEENETEMKVEALIDINLALEGKRYIESIFKTYKTKKDEIDGIIKQYAIGWDIDRLFKIDKDILRIAIIELVYVKDAPVKVVIDEALELAKKYSTDDSPSFINGILAKVVEAYV